MKMSLSASAENVSSSTDAQSGDSGNMCLELALEGERLCKAGDCRSGVVFFQAAIKAGTDDLRTLSAIYSQLGNAYFYLGDFINAKHFHKLDLALAKTMGDKLGEAKSSGNLGSTLKVMGEFDEAMTYCKRHLKIARELNDKLCEGRALYNMGNVYHAKGKYIGRAEQQDPENFPEDVRECLQQAVFYYEENLKIMKELNDTAAQGRTCGNLGNTYYLLGNFREGIKYHQERLNIAREFGDKAGERRAYSNLGNCYIFLNEFEMAAESYKRTLVLAQELDDKAVEAQAYYNLGNTYTLRRDYPTAIDYHLRHLHIAQTLKDHVGEGRAYWSLGNAHTSMGNHEKALYFATKHQEISKQIGDAVGQATAQMNISDLRKVLGMPDGGISPDSSKLIEATAAQPSPSLRRYRVRRDSMNHLDIIKLTPDAKNKVEATLTHTPVPQGHMNQQGEDEDSFFDLLSRFQSERMDDQRCSLSVPSENKENFSSNKQTNFNNGDAQEELIDLIVGMQSKRMDEQRVALPHLPGLPPAGPDDNFFDMLMRCQSERLEDQRSPLPSSTTDDPPSPTGTTVPDEDFFSLIMRLQSGRMEDQRATVPNSK